MIRITRRHFAAGAAALAVTTVAPSLTLGRQDSSELLAQIPGLSSAYARRYDAADSHAHHEMTGEEIEVTEETPSHLVINALEFESAEMMERILGMMLSVETAGLLMSDTDIELTEEPAGDFPRGSMFYYGNRDDGEYASLLVIPSGNMAYGITARGDSDAVQVTADAIGAFLLEQELGDSPVVVVTEGVAEGGVFDAFPGVDDLELLNGLIPMYDYDLLVSESPILPPGGTPEASPAS